MRIYKIKMDKEYVIYKTTNKLNGKFYIGKDEHNNPKYLGSGKLLHQAIKKYGRENFEKEIIEYCSSQTHCDREVFWINELNSFSPKGYNIMDGSFGSFGGDNYTHHPNKKLYRKRISKALTGKKHSKIHNERIGKGKLGNLNPAKRDDVRTKISESRKGKSIGDENSMFKSNRTRDKLKNLDIELKGDRWEYLRNKIKCTNIKTQEVFIFDGVKEVVETLKISKNKYYNHVNTNEPIKGKFICEKI
jgi:group I intron endonuclease